MIVCLFDPLILPTGTSVSFVDITTVVLTGAVSIANTAAYNGGSNIACPLIGVDVCVLNHFGAHEKLVCTTTNALGMWHVA